MQRITTFVWEQHQTWPMTGLYCCIVKYTQQKPWIIPGSTEKLLKIIKKVKKFKDTTGTWAIDRQGDKSDLIRCFTDDSLQFVTRLKMSRYLHFGKNTNRQVKAERIDRHV